jgi:hypothetical protein
MFRVLLHPSSGAPTVAYSHRCVCVCNSFGVLIHWSRYWLGHPRTFTTVRLRHLVGPLIEHILPICTEPWTLSSTLSLLKQYSVLGGFQTAKEERLLLNVLKNRRHLWIGHIIRHNKLVVNISEGAISVEKAVGRPRLQYLKQVTRNLFGRYFT